MGKGALRRLLGTHGKKPLSIIKILRWPAKRYWKRMKQRNTMRMRKTKTTGRMRSLTFPSNHPSSSADLADSAFRCFGRLLVTLKRQELMMTKIYERLFPIEGISGGGDDSGNTAPYRVFSSLTHLLVLCTLFYSYFRSSVC